MYLYCFEIIGAKTALAVILQEYPSCSVLPLCMTEDRNPKSVFRDLVERFWRAYEDSAVLKCSRRLPRLNAHRVRAALKEFRTIIELH